MGITRDDLDILKRVLPSVGRERMLMYGIQDLGVSRDQTQAVLPLRDPVPDSGEWGSPELFRGLGFRFVESLDIAATPPPTFLHNMNEPLPKTFWDRYDFIYDGGTLEHIFNTPQALENTVRSLRGDGVVLHRLPMNNSVNHGFYQFSPGLFFDYYLANGFEDCNLFLAEGGGDVRRYGYRDIIPDRVLRRHSMLGFAARKTSVDEISVPTQFMYAPNTRFLTEELGDSPFYIWGASGGFFQVYGEWFERNRETLRCLGFIDSDPSRQGREIMGCPVLAPEVLLREQRRPIILVASTWWPQISDQIEDMGLDLRLMR
ncbi:nucleoside-diphosphate sugar epimerase/dehydratase [Paucidesulfovibrio longus]|uniref:nucleoside-diphosphate sugar epimerase/dehydratase n=1 Tax=Paucidesulfovibrio longus TaxID=889 RepID=UPI0003B3B815|nr:hypothetical protein [Paucidesulfovibrio longus]